MIEKSPIIKNAAEVGLLAADILLLGELTAAKLLTTKVIKDLVLKRTGTELSEIEAMKISNNFYADGASSSPAGLYTSGGVIPANPNKTTTVLGRYINDMESVIDIQMNAMKTSDFGARTGGFNVLNVSKSVEDAAGRQFFEAVNKPFLDAALKRGDDVALATIPKNPLDVFTIDGALKGNYAKELDYLVKNNYKPVNVSLAQWNTIKGWFK